MDKPSTKFILPDCKDEYDHDEDVWVLTCPACGCQEDGYMWEEGDLLDECLDCGIPMNRRAIVGGVKDGCLTVWAVADPEEEVLSLSKLGRS